MLPPLSEDHLGGAVTVFFKIEKEIQRFVFVLINRYRYNILRQQQKLKQTVMCVN